jgi:hypothetical protein
LVQLCCSNKNEGTSRNISGVGSVDGVVLVEVRVMPMVVAEVAELVKVVEVAI